MCRYEEKRFIRVRDDTEYYPREGAAMILGSFFSGILSIWATASRPRDTVEIWGRCLEARAQQSHISFWISNGGVQSVGISIFSPVLIAMQACVLFFPGHGVFASAKISHLKCPVSDCACYPIKTSLTCA